MRTTVALDDDVARAVEELRRAEGLGISAAINVLARRGLAHGRDERRPFSQQVSAMGAPRVPLDDVGAVLEAIEDSPSRAE